jgi:predicted CXXCH cytochrome family protein
MKKICRKFQTSLWLFTFFAAFISTSTLTYAQKQPAASEPSTVSWKAPIAGKASDYTGVETCTQCHRVRVEQLAKTVHARTEVAGTKSGTNCEACHGAGKAHADAELEAERTSTKNPEAKKLIFGFHGGPQENAARCLACHQTSREHDLYGRSEHKLQGISCDQCHAAHLVLAQGAGERIEPSLAQPQFFAAPKLREEIRWLNQSLLRQPQPDLCFTCHRTIEGQFALPTHHRVPEGLMKCSDCHNPHGTRTRPLLRKTNWEACVSCHVEKRGPFVFEHPSVKVEGCVVCHTPHGSPNRNLLRRGEGRFLCLSCHVDPFAANVPHGRLSYQTRGECVRCHAVIHGSNNSEFFLQ